MRTCTFECDSEQCSDIQNKFLRLLQTILCTYVYMESTVKWPFSIIEMKLISRIDQYYRSKSASEYDIQWNCDYPSGMLRTYGLTDQHKNTGNRPFSVRIFMTKADTDNRSSIVLKNQIRITHTILAIQESSHLFKLTAKNALTNKMTIWKLVITLFLYKLIFVLFVISHSKLYSSLWN